MVYKYAGKDGSDTYNQFHAEDLIEKELSSSEKKGLLDETTITETWVNAQKEELVSQPAPNEKPPLSSIINLDDFERAFEKTGSQKAQAYVSGASNDLLSLNANKLCWQKLWFRPRVMRNVSKPSIDSRMLGCDVSMPVWICPMGIGKTGGPEGEKALAAGAASSGIVHCVSTTASFGIEDIIASAPSTQPFFFQLYVDRQRHKTEALLQRVNSLKQIKAIFVTADLAVVSKREADERIRAQQEMPAYTQDSQSRADQKGGGLARQTGSFIDPALSWDDLAWVRKHTNLPIIVKGIQSAADAKTALKMGCAGIVVSNHGGRALDGSPGTVVVLLEIRRDCPEVFDGMDVFVDGGVRRGSDVLKAICLGARGVGVGRPFQYSISYGQEGVEAAASSKLSSSQSLVRLLIYDIYHSPSR